jgi:hypothetical protein
MIAEVAMGKTAFEDLPILLDPLRYFGFEFGLNHAAPKRMIRTAIGGLDITGNPIRRNDNVIIGPEQQIAAGGFNGAVATERVPLLRLMQGAHGVLLSEVGRLEFPDDLRGLVRRVVIDDQEAQLKIVRKFEARKTVKRLRQQDLSIPGADGNLNSCDFAR